jgi:hypothetical protein
MLREKEKMFQGLVEEKEKLLREKEKMFQGLVEEKERLVEEKEKRITEKDEQLATAIESMTLHKQNEAKVVSALIDVRKQHIPICHWGEPHNAPCHHTSVLTISYRFCHSHRDVG